MQQEQPVDAQLPRDPRQPPLRMPATAEEALDIYRNWDHRNGRYFIVADVQLDTGKRLENVTFDADSRVAVEFRSEPIASQPAVLGAQIHEARIRSDYSAGRSATDNPPS